MKKPSDARRRKYKVWEDLYDKIFSGKGSIEPYVISFHLHRLAGLWLRSSGSTAESDDMIRRLAKNGSFHVARIAAYTWRNGDDWRGTTNELANQINVLETRPAQLDKHFDNALKTFKAIVQGSPQYVADIDSAMKSANLDEDIDRQLYQSTAAVRNVVAR